MVRARCRFREGPRAHEHLPTRSACIAKSQELWVLDLLQCSEVGPPESQLHLAEHAEALWPQEGSACARYGAAALLAEQRRFMGSKWPESWRSL